MLCDICHENDVVVTLTEINGDGVRQVRLCEKCAAERGVQGVFTSPAPSLGSFVQSVHQQVTPLQGDDVTCSFCSATLRDFRQTGRLGCAHCYTAFEHGLRDLLRRVQGSSCHIGRVYDPPLDQHMLETATADQLRNKLQRAVEREQFELAAALRDQLRAIG